MKLFLPPNIYAGILKSFLKQYKELDIEIKESSLLSNELENDKDAVALIPSMDLINHREVFVSGKAGISFDGTLSNAYFYLTDNSQRTLGNIYIRGDVSVNEIILTKILFEERFSAEVEITLDTHKDPTNTQNTLVVGIENFTNWDYNSSISFSDQMADLLDLPYVNFIFASYNKGNLSRLESFFNGVDASVEENISELLNDLSLSEEIKNYVQSNLGSVYFEMTSNESEALNEMIKLVYYHGIIEDIFDVKFI
ncbi:MAG: hypothetical protein GYA14_03730 [Ignavibacteria bacterium]|nr:hypothetical protein [Ignavibacteria bacterium]